jgi:hypothetical protein
MSQKYPQVWMEVRQNRGQVKREDLDRWLDEAKSDQEKYNLQYDEYNDADTSYREAEQLVVQINQSASVAEILKQEPVLAKYIDMVGQSSEMSGHPASRETVGWLRVDFVDEDWLLVDEVQSDLVNSVSQAKLILEAEDFEAFMASLANDKVRAMVAEKGITAQNFQQARGRMEQEGYDLDSLEAIKQRMVELFEDWAEFGMASLIDLARRHGIKNVAIHTAETIAVRDDSVEAQKIHMYYDSLAKSFGFKKQQVDVGDLQGKFWVRTAAAKPSLPLPSLKELTKAFPGEIDERDMDKYRYWVKAHQSGTRFPLTLYRAIGAPSENKIKWNKVGTFWSASEAGAHHGAVETGEFNDGDTLFCIKAVVTSSSDVDWYETIRANIMFGEGEKEITVKSGRRLKLVGVKAFNEDGHTRLGDGFKPEGVTQITAAAKKKPEPDHYELGVFNSPFGGWILRDGKDYGITDAEADSGGYGHDAAARRLGFKDSPDALNHGAVRVDLKSAGGTFFEVSRIDDNTRSLLKDAMHSAYSPISIEWWNPGEKTTVFESKEEALDWLENRTVMTASVGGYSAQDEDLPDIFWPDDDYYMTEGCGIWAVDFATKNGGEIYILSSDGGEIWDEGGDTNYEVTHAYVKKDGRTFDVRGERPVAEMAKELNVGIYSIKGPWAPDVFEARFMGNSDDKPLYGRKQAGMKFPQTLEWIGRAKEFLKQKWAERHKELKREGMPTDLAGACKFASLFAQSLFGGVIKGNPQHQVLKGPKGIIDLTDAFDPSTFHHDTEFFGNPEHLKSMASCKARVAQWIAEFTKKYDGQHKAGSWKKKPPMKPLVEDPEAYAEARRDPRQVSLYGKGHEEELHDMYAKPENSFKASLLHEPEDDK